MRRLRVLASLPAVVAGGVAGLAAIVLTDIDHFANTIADKIAGIQED